MSSTIEPATTTPAEAAFRDLPELSRLESDRFCRSCGYNLRQQPVRREPRTKLALVQCPECGAFDPVTEAAGRSALWLAWLHRALLFAWIGMLLLGAWIAGAVFYIIAYEMPMFRYSRSWTGTGMVINWQPWTRDEVLELVLMGGIGALLGATVGLVLAVVFPHWRRWGYAIPLVLLTGGAAFFALWDWSWQSDRARVWQAAVPWVLASQLIVLAAGLAGAAFGRPIARLAVRALIPPGARGPLAYLWLADGKTPPARRGSRRDG